VFLLLPSCDLSLSGDSFAVLSAPLKLLEGAFNAWKEGLAKFNLIRSWTELIFLSRKIRSVSSCFFLYQYEQMSIVARHLAQSGGIVEIMRGCDILFTLSLYYPGIQIKGAIDDDSYIHGMI
jgi:hypothetical protein